MRKLNLCRNGHDILTFFLWVREHYGWEFGIRDFLLCYLNDRLFREPENLHPLLYEWGGDTVHGSVHESYGCYWAPISNGIRHS